MTKSDIIKETLRQTRLKRSTQDCKVFELKIDTSHISNKKLNDLKLLFTESKWLYNHILNQKNIFDFDTKISVVQALDKDKNTVDKTLSIIGSQIKQSIHSRIIDSIIALSKLKEKHYKVGKLKFKSRIKSIPLKQYGVTFRFNPTKPNYIKFQNIKGYFKLNGIKQIPQNAEITNAILINKNNNYYIKLTCYIQKETKNFLEKEIGIDFGIQDNIVLSNGEKFNINIPESTRTRKLRRKLSRKHGYKKGQKKSKSFYKNLNLINASIDKINNQKKDCKNKIVSKIVNNYETVCVQDENIKQWKDGMFGKQVHNSVLGGIMKDLCVKSHTLKIVDKYMPTTQLCPVCFKLNKISLKQREYICECGYKNDRDIHAAQNILNIGMNRLDINKVSTEYRHYKSPMEGIVSAVDLNSKLFLLKSEANVL